MLTWSCKRTCFITIPCSQAIEEPPVHDDDAMKLWLERMRSNRRQLITVRDERRRRRNDMTRRRTQASQQRMKLITELAQGMLLDRGGGTRT